jgi:arsenite methyltransferase
LAVFDCP